MSIRIKTISLMLACASTSFAGQAFAAENTLQVWVNPGIYSYHFNRDKGYRDNNIGAGAEVLVTNEHGVMAGTFINSERARSHYVAYQWRPLHWQPAQGLHVSAGVIAGAFDGYPNMRNGGWFVAPLPLLAVEYRRVGANFTIVPDYGNRLHGAVAIQIKLRVW
jgi:hypothetical protein